MTAWAGTAAVALGIIAGGMALMFNFPGMVPTVVMMTLGGALILNADSIGGTMGWGDPLSGDPLSDLVGFMAAHSLDLVLSSVVLLAALMFVIPALLALLGQGQRAAEGEASGTVECTVPSPKKIVPAPPRKLGGVCEYCGCNPCGCGASGEPT